MELKDIYGLWDRFDQSDITELELDYHGVHFHLKSDRMVETDKIIDKVPSPVSRTDLTAAGNHHAAQDVNTQSKESESSSRSVGNLKEMKAPLIGVFYTSPSPDEKPYIIPGQKVHKGDVIGIIEAMKCMNEISMPEDGIIEEILIENESMVEFDQPIITFHPAGE